MNEKDVFCSFCGDYMTKMGAGVFCAKCGSKMPVGGGVCLKCGNTVENRYHNRRKKKKSKIIVCVLLFVIAALGIGLGILSLADSDKEDLVTDGDVSVTESAADVVSSTEVQTSEEATKKYEEKNEIITEESKIAITNTMVEAATMTTTSTTVATTTATTVAATVTTTASAATTATVDDTAFYPISRELMYSDDYIMPTDIRYITADELDKFGYYEMDYVTNEIYARHGYIFKTEKFAEYFGSKSWYKGTISDMSEVEKMMSTIEMTNLQTIVAYEKAKGWR